MDLLFLCGPPASGKYTIGRRVADDTGYALFHNHLIVDAVASVFPFGSASFVRLRERFWMETFAAAGSEDRSLIFTFQPEASVSSGFARDVARLVQGTGGRFVLVQLQLSRAAQIERIANADRARFGKLRDPDLLATLQDEFEACEAAMPKPELVIDTQSTSADEAARRIVGLVQKT